MASNTPETRYRQLHELLSRDEALVKWMITVMQENQWKIVVREGKLLTPDEFSQVVQPAVVKVPALSDIVSDGGTILELTPDQILENLISIIGLVQFKAISENEATFNWRTMSKVGIRL